MKVNLGYACINTTLKESHQVCCNKTCRLATAIRQGTNTETPKASSEYSKAIYDFLVEYGRNNLTEMYKIISWSRKNNIYFYRMSSDMFPHINNGKLKEHMTEQDWKKYSDLSFVYDIIEQIGAYVQKYQIRLTMHPGHYNQLGSPKKEVLSNTLTDLSWHALLLELLERAAERYNLYLSENDREILPNILKNSILCIHGGGTYGDKEKTLARWQKNFKQLPEYIKKRIALENDEKSYSEQDLLPICINLKIPLIFDFHHYNCWSHYNPEDKQKEIKDFLPLILKTWENRNIKPKFHLSDQAENKRVGAHHDYVEDIPIELLNLKAAKYEFDMMIEAKMKELAVIRLRKKYNI